MLATSCICRWLNDSSPSSPRITAAACRAVLRIRPSTWAKQPFATACGRALSRLTRATQATPSRVSVSRTTASMKVFSGSGIDSTATITAVKPLSTKACESV